MLLLYLLDSMRGEAAMALSQARSQGRTTSRSPPEDDRAYFRLIDDALKYRADRKIRNSKPVHALYVLRKFLTCARAEVRIYTGRLSRSIGHLRAYADPDIVRSAIEFLRKENSRLSIIILGEPDVDPGQSIGSHPLLAAIAAAEGIRGTVRVSRGKPGEWEEFPYHFIIMDREAVRIEFDGNCADAAVRFGDAHFATRLVRIFDELERAGSPLLLVGAGVPETKLPDGSNTGAPST